MKHKTIKQTEENLDMRTAMTSDNKTEVPTDEFDNSNFYFLWPYSNPFMPRVDLSFVFDWLISLVNSLIKRIKRNK